MTSEQIDKSIGSGKVQLNKGEIVEYWLNFIFLLLPVYFFGQVSIYTIFSFSELPILSVTLLGLLVYHKLVSQKLKIYNLSLTGKLFKDANLATVTLSDWNVLTNTDECFVAIKSTTWRWDGIRITAINKNGKLYLNSMVEPSFRANPVTLGSNKRNIMVLLDQYQKALNGEDVISKANIEVAKNEHDFWEESEFTLVNNLKRIIGYGLSLFFIALSIWMIIKGKLQGLLYAIIILGLFGNYVFYDLKIILERKRRRRDEL